MNKKDNLDYIFNIDIEDDTLFSTIRHDLKNGLNQLVLAEYDKYGNTERIKRVSEMIDEMVTSDYIFKKKKEFSCK